MTKDTLMVIYYRYTKIKNADAGGKSDTCIDENQKSFLGIQYLKVYNELPIKKIHIF